ncbi:MAG: pyridoxal-phosphate dependent enzyme, partial [Ruthenibacterium sp.]
EIYGAPVHFVDSDTYVDVYAEMDRLAEELKKEGHKPYCIPVGGSTALGALGYVACVEELAQQAQALGFAPSCIVGATGSGGTTAGLLLGAKLFLPQTKTLGIGVDDDDFDHIVPTLAHEAAALLERSLDIAPQDFEMVYHFGAGYSIPNAEDTPAMLRLAREEGILLDPIYTGKAFSGMLKLLGEGYFDSMEDIIFIHTGGAAALFAVDLA